MGSYTFNYCAIENLTLPETIQSIGSYTFQYCKALKNLRVRATTPPSIGSYVFRYANDFYNIVVHHDYVVRYREAWSSYSGHIIADND